MKNIIILFLVIICFASCSSNLDAVVEYLRKVHPEKVAFATNVKYTVGDSVLTDDVLELYANELYIAKRDYENDYISKETFVKYLNNFKRKFDEVENTWIMGTPLSNVAKRNTEYNGLWKQGYTVEISYGKNKVEYFNIAVDSEDDSMYVVTDEYKVRDAFKIYKELINECDDLDK